MSRFRFRLQPVLEQRSRVERDQQRVVAELERERLDLESQLRSLARGRDAEREAWTAVLGGDSTRTGSAGAGAGAGVGSGAGSGPARLDLGGIRTQAGAALGREVEARRVAVRLAGVYERLKTQRARLIELAAARRALELLRDRQLEAFREVESRRERAALDDVVMAMHARGGPSV